MISVHKSVLLKEVVEALNIKGGIIAVDATLGGGGHSLEILEKILPEGKLIAIDRDEEAIERFQKKIENLNLKKGDIEIVKDNFRNIGKVLDDLNIISADAILADFGVSSDQLEEGERGFSFLKESRLDMRMDKSERLDAWKVVNEYSEADLEKVIRIYGEEKYSRSIAKRIAVVRKNKPISTTSELVSVIEVAVPGKYRHERIHFATRTFQAIRMEVNAELESISEFIKSSIERLKNGGRLAVITFHSGEDRIAKDLFRENARGCICPKEFPICQCGRKPTVRIVTKKPIIPSQEEIAVNPRARSAKLRVVEKI